MKLFKTNFIKFICVLLFLIGFNNLELYAQVIVEIDANDLGPAVDDGMFGANLVYTWSNFDQLDQIGSQADFSVIRYPGGSVTENEFDLTNPNQYLSYTSNGSNTVSANKSIGRFIEEINQSNYTGVFVLPTKRFVGNEATGTAQVKSYVTKILNGDYGTIVNGRTIHFEVGNEFFWGSDNITGTQYGKVAVALIKGVNQGISNSTASGSYNIQISVQSGVKDGEAAAVAGEFKNKPERYDIDFLTWHWYPGQIDVNLGLTSFYSKAQLLSDRLEDIRDEWTAAQVNVPFFISEFNIRNTTTNNNEPNYDHGLRNPMGIMSIFAESVRANAKMATIWPLISDTSLKTRLFNQDATPTFNGIYYKWMESELRGKSIINGIQNNSYSNKYNFRSDGTYVEAFISNDEMVIFVHETEHAKRQFVIKLDGFVITSRKADVLYTTAGNETDHSATPLLGKRWPKVWNSGKNITFTSNKSSKYEVIKIVLKGYKTSSKPGKPVTENAVLPNGKSEIRIFPNPVNSDIMYIETEQDLRTVSIFNTNGSLETKQDLAGKLTTDINVSKLRPGFYMMKIETADGNVIAKSMIKM